MSSVQCSLQDTAHTSLASGGVLSNQSKRVEKPEGASSHLVRQLLLQSMEPPEGVLKLAAILLAREPAHPTPCRTQVKEPVSSKPGNDHYSPSILSSFWSRTSLSCVWARPVETGEKAAGQIRTEEEDTTTCQVQWTSSPHCTQ